MLTIIAYHIRTYRAGDAGYYAAHQRDTIDVWEDSKRYIYRQTGALTHKQIKSQLVDAFGEHGSRTVKISGRWPNYTIETEC